MTSMRNHLAAITLCVVLVTSMAAVFAAETLTYRDLVRRYTDLERLAVLPDGSEKAAMASSYLRDSKYDAENDKYVGWGANGDGWGFIRKEGDSIVMAELEGPGCIWRIWSAAPEQGHVRMYFDGAEKPTFDMPFRDYFKGEVAPFTRKNLTYVAASGWNMYLPIPYQKSCKIVADEKWGGFYHFNYTTFPKGTKLPTFSAELPTDDAKALNELDEFFATKIGDDPKGKKDGEETVSKGIELKPGQSVTLADIKGPRAITAIRFKMAFGDRESEMAPLRELALRITWDGQDKPAVLCPLGDFFGTAPGFNKFKSLPVGMTDDGFYCYWYMPFAKSALVELVNDGKTETRKVEYSITHAPLGRSFDGLGHFHAKWHRDTGRVPKDRPVDWELLLTKGKGRFLGAMLHCWNPYDGWWGEGDEKFFVDGEKFPSTFGTGTEDYFGYAWGNPSLFERPFHGQTMSMGNAGHQALYRWQIADEVPFTSSFDGYLEKYDQYQPVSDFAVMTVWYLSPDGTDDYGIPPVEERTGYFSWPPTKVSGIHLLEFPKRGKVKAQDMRRFPGFKWTNNEQLLWVDGQVGDSITVLVDAKETGKYKLEAILTKSQDYAIIEISLDGKTLGEQIDLFDMKTQPYGPIDLGTHDLEKGQHKLEFKLAGFNEEEQKVRPNCRFMGIDDIRLTPEK